MTDAAGARSAPARRRLPWHLLQSDFWAEHKSAFGWEAVVVDTPELADAGSVLTLSRRLPAGVLLTYVPYAPALPGGGSGPGLPGPALERLPRLLGEVAPAVEAEVATRLRRRPTLIRFDLPQRAGEWSVGPAHDGEDEPATARLSRSPVQVQPPDTVVLDLGLDESALLAGMHKKNRYNVRLAERKGVTVREAGPDELPLWYALYEETARRDRITIHSRDYYARLFELASSYEEVDLRLYLAEHDRDLLAGIIVARYRGGATYLYGASSNEKRNLMPNYALQWRAIRDARSAGCAWYDLFGVPPADDPAHPMHGLYRFKVGFGGELVHRAGAWDWAVRPVSARLYRLAEAARDVYFHGLRGGHAR